MEKEKKSLRFKVVIAIAIALLLLMVPVVYFSTATYSTGDPDKDYELYHELRPRRLFTFHQLMDEIVHEEAGLGDVRTFISNRWDLHKAVSYLKSAAEKGHSHAQYILSLRYYSGDGVSLDIQKGNEWLIKSADNGNFDALGSLAWKYYCGPTHPASRVGTPQYEKSKYAFPKDEKKAIEIYKKGVEKGDPSMGYDLAKIYKIKKDDKEAFKWAMTSAKMGFAYAQEFVGMAYYNGKGVDKNYKEAVRWLKEALKQDSGRVVIDHLGDAYYALGEKEKARKEWEKALKLSYDEESKEKIQEKLAK